MSRYMNKNRKRKLPIGHAMMAWADWEMGMLLWNDDILAKRYALHQQNQIRSMSGHRVSVYWKDKEPRETRTKFLPNTVSDINELWDLLMPQGLQPYEINCPTIKFIVNRLWSACNVKIGPWLQNHWLRNIPLYTLEEIRDAWYAHRRQRDFRIKGLGTFQTREATLQVMTTRIHRVSDYTPPVPDTILEMALEQQGYNFRFHWVQRMRRYRKVKDFIIRYHKSITEGQFHELDRIFFRSLGAGVGVRGGRADMQFPVTLADFRRQLAQLQEERRQRIMPRPEPIVMAEEFTVVPTKWGTLTPVDHTRKLFGYGEELHNCLASYAQHCIAGKSFIFVLLNEQDKAIAAVEADQDGKVVQVSGHCNRDVGQEMRSDLVKAVAVAFELRQQVPDPALERAEELVD